MKFCANLAFMFTESSSILERYALAKDAGFKAVETGFPWGYTLEQVKQAKETAGVQQVLINLKTGKMFNNLYIKQNLGSDIVHKHQNNVYML